MTAFSLAELSNEMFSTCDRLAAIAGRQCSTRATAIDLKRIVGRLGRRIACPPRIVLLGEFNAGKSTLANALLGVELLPTSIHANTRVPILVHYSATPTLSYETADRTQRPITLSSIEDLRQGNARMLRVGLPVERLKSIELIDTPGLATGSTHLDDLVLEACRRSNIAVWCTVATQAWKATEQATWAAAPRRLRTRSVLAVTRADAIHSDRDSERLRKRLAIEAQPHFGEVRLIAAEDARLARGTAAHGAALGEGAATAWQTSGGADLEAALGVLIDRELAARRAGAQRLLERLAVRLAGTATTATATSIVTGQTSAAA